MKNKKTRAFLLISALPLFILIVLFGTLSQQTAVAADSQSAALRPNRAPAAVSFPDPIAYWSFDDGADPTSDLITGNHDGDLQGGAGFTTAVPAQIGNGQAVSLDGVDDKVVDDLGDESDFDFVSQMTVAFWVKVDNFDTNWQALVTKGDSSWRVHRYQNSGAIAFGTSGLSPTDLVSTVTIDDGQWHHVAVTLNGTAKSIYIDGIGSTDLSGSGGLTTNNEPVWIGANSQASGREFDGSIDDVRIYDTALSAAQITALASGDVGFLCFSESDGDAATDFVSNDAQAIQRAVDQASANDTIKAAGTCAGVQTQSGETQTVYIDESITLEGGHTATDWLTASDPEQYPTTLDAEGNGRVAYLPTGNTVILDGLTMINGYTAIDGGGIYNESDLTIQNSLVENNEAGDDGGSIYNTGELIVNYSLVADNKAGDKGGGVYNDNSVTISNSTLRDNQVPVGNSHYGGGLYSRGATNQVIIKESALLSNTAHSGGGVYIFLGTLTMNDSTVAYNVAGVQGGGINFSAGYAGGIYTIENSTISNNSVLGGGGGGIGHAGSGNESSTLTIRYSTILSNTANTGAGIYTQDTDDLGTIITRLSNTIVVNRNNNNPECSVIGAGAVMDSSDGYNIDSDGSCIANGGPGNQTDANPNLGALADNGGNTLTHALLPGSPAIDAGDPAYPTIGGGYDQRGANYPRVYNGVLDIGAYELSPDPVCFVSINSSGVADYASPDASAVQTAVNAATANDLLKVAGTCTGVQVQGGLRQTVYINKNVTIQGGYNVTDTLPTTNWAATPDPSAYPTILDADNNGRVAVVSGAGVRATINNLILIRGNSGAGNGGIDGGGGIIAGRNTVVTVTNSILQQNSGNDGAAVYARGEFSLSHTLVATNTAVNNGGGFFIDANSSTTIANSTISGNRANNGNGGGIYADGTLNLAHSTVSYNTRGGIYSNDGPVSVNHSIVSDNNGGNCIINILGGSGSISDAGYNLTDNNECLFNGTGSMRNTDPMLGSLADNGGNSLTHALLSGSPAVDAGDPAYSVVAGDYDQRGVGYPRVYNDHLDIGAYEAQLICGVTAGNSYTFSDVVIAIDPDGLGDIDCLQVFPFYGQNHPAATLGIETGAYWRINATNSGGATASNYTTTLTITVSFPPDANDKLCRYTGSSWDCAANSFDAGLRTITREDVTQFSDWAAGDNVGPTAVSLQTFTANTTPIKPTSALLTFAMLMSISLRGWYNKRRDSQLKV